MPRDDLHDFTVEPVEGLPEQPPTGELILWQGRPNTWALAKDALGVHWVAGYFVLLAIWRVGASSADLPVAAALPLALPFLILGLATCLVFLGVAHVLARTTMYTITTERVAMRVGAALTVTLNLPFTKIASADLRLSKNGHGSVVFHPMGEARLSYLVLWPHVRPWRMRRTQPSLRAIPDARNVARIFSEAAETRISQPQVRSSGSHMPSDDIVAAE